MITLHDLYNEGVEEALHLEALITEATGRLGRVRGRLDGFAHLIEAGHGAIVVPDPDPAPEPQSAPASDGAIHPPVETAPEQASTSAPTPRSGAAPDLRL